MPNVILGVIGNGRKELLDRTIQSAKENLNYPFIKKIMINDTGDAQYAIQLEQEYGDEWHIISHQQNQGLSGSVRSLWAAALLLDADYVFHLEEDFTFNEPIYHEDFKDMMDLLNHPSYKIAQMALKRQPCNSEEAHAGGFMQLNYQCYTEFHEMGMAWVLHRLFFTLNPSLYPRWVIELGWEQGWGEKEFGERLFADPSISCGYVGRINNPPLVTHIGNYRGNNWFV